MKILKKILKITGIFLIVLIAAVILIPIIFKGKILEIAQAEANKNMNAIVKFEDLNVSMIRSFPDISVELVNLSIVGKDAFANDTLVKFKSFYAGLNLMSVISGDKIKVNAIILDSPKFNAKVLADGTANWDIALPDTTTTVKDSTFADTAESKYAISLKKFEIKNCDVTYDDKVGNMYARIKNFNFLLKGDMTQDLTNLDIKTAIDSLTVQMGNVKYLKKAKLGFDSKIAADIKNMKFKFEENEFRLNDLALGFDGTVEMPDTNIVMDVKFKTKKTKFKSVLSLIPAIYAKDFATIKTSGDFALNGYVKGTSNSTTIPGFGVYLAVNNARFQYPDLPKSVENINIKVKVDAKEGTGEYMKIDLQKAHIEMAGNPVNAKLIANMSPADISMDGNVEGKIVLSSLKDVVPLEGMDLNGTVTMNLNYKGNLSDIEKEQYDKFKANGELGIGNFVMKSEGTPDVKISKMQMDFSPQNVNLKQFDATAGKSDFHLTGTIDNLLSYVFKSETLKGSFNFSSNLIDANEFLSGDEATTGEKTEPATAQTDTVSSGAVEIPKNIDFVLKTNLNKVIYDKLDITNINGLISLKEGVASLNQLKMNMLQGSLALSGKYNSQDISKPKADFGLDISKFDIHETYEAFNTVQTIAPIAKNCNGKISVKMTLNTILNKDMMPVMNTVNSKGRFKSDNIGIKNNKIFGLIADKTKQEKYRNPSMKNVNVGFKIENGNLTVEKNTMKIAGSEVTVEGTQNLDTKINFDLGMKLPKGAATNVLSKLPLKNVPDQIEVTAKIGGTSTKPKIIGFKSNATDGVKKQVEEKIEEVKENLKEKAKKILADAQAQADKVMAAARASAKKVRETADKAGKRLISEADKQGKALIKKAGRNPLKKRAAKIAANKLTKVAKNKAKKLNSEADKKAKVIINTAQKKSDKIMKTANDKVKKL